MADFETDVAILTIFVHGEKSLKHTGAMVLVSEAQTLTRIWKRHPQLLRLIYRARHFDFRDFTLHQSLSYG